jgi:hypothetical protein
MSRLHNLPPPAPEDDSVISVNLVARRSRRFDRFAAMPRGRVVALAVGAIVLGIVLTLACAGALSSGGWQGAGRVGL